MGRDIGISATLQDYILGHIPPEPDILKELAVETKTLGTISAMQIGWLQGCFMQNLVRLTGAKNIIEIGVFTGYSALATALALPTDGHITALDIAGDWTVMAQKYWKKAGVDDKIDLHLAPAAETLKSLIEQGQAGQFDMVFIDADKGSMEQYLRLSKTLLRQNGLVIADNVLWSEHVLDANDESEDTLAIKAFNKAFQKNDDFYLSMIPVGDGISLGVKK